jgi:DNA-binding response OmpR family regulator
VASKSGSPFQILIVEDEPALRGSMADLLTFSGYAVTVAKDGLIALQLLAAHIPHLVLTDLMMPGMDGYQLVKHLRSTPATSEIPIIILSGRTTQDGFDQGVLLGRNKYLTKPFAFSELLSAVDELLVASSTHSRQQISGQRFE